jgi:hypothetical protein
MMIAIYVYSKKRDPTYKVIERSCLPDKHLSKMLNPCRTEAKIKFMSDEIK